MLALQGRNLACLGRDGSEPGSAALRAAAAQLGARLAWLPGVPWPPTAAASSTQGHRLPNGVLQRLYDLVVLPGGSPGEAEALAREAGLPILVWQPPEAAPGGLQESTSALAQRLLGALRLG
jgi:hypothetical protein